MTVSRGSRRIRILALLIGPIVAACGAPPSPTRAPRSEQSSPAAASSQLVVTGRGRADCPGSPFGCLVTFVVAPPDLPLPDSWEPARSDPAFDHTMTGTQIEVVRGNPAGLPATIGVGRHRLVGSVSGVSDIVGGPGPSAGPSLFWTFTCSADIDVKAATTAVRVDVTFVPTDDPTCRIEARQD